MDEKRVKEILSDEAFVKKLLELDTPEEVQAALKGKGIDMTEDEIVQLRDIVAKMAEKAQEEGELSLDQLDDAAGGGAILATIVGPTLLVGAGLGILGAMVGAGAVGSGVLLAVKHRRW